MTYQSEVLADSPLGYWPLDTNATDASGNGRNGTVTGTLTFGGAGPNGAGAVSGFSGSNYISLPTSAYVSGPFTFEAWVKTASAPWAFFFAVGSSSGMLGTNGSTGKVTYVAASGNNVDGTTISDNAWRHVAVTRDGSGNLALYVNKVSVATSTGVAAPPTATTIRVGTDTNSANAWPGSVARVAIYSTALSAARIGAHYDASASLVGLTLSGTLPAITASLTLSSWTDTVTANDWQGRVRDGSFQDESETPVEPLPAGVVRAVKVDKALAYPTPTLVNGRPT